MSFMLDSSINACMVYNSICLRFHSIAIVLALTSDQDRTHYWLFESSALIGQHLNSLRVTYENILHRPYSRFFLLSTLGIMHCTCVHMLVQYWYVLFNAVA